MARAMWLVALVVLGGAARADDNGEAKAAFVEGRRLYTVGDYRGALEAFKASYLKYEAPDTLFNMAQCQRLLGNHGEAARMYRNYLDLSPSAPDRAEVQRVLAEEERAAAAKPEPPSKPQREPAPPVQQEGRSRAWVAVLVAAIVAMAGTAVGITLALTLKREAPDPMTSAGVQMVTFP
jgi:tetratricopeptide (TPR) repeat protein